MQQAPTIFFFKRPIKNLLIVSILTLCIIHGCTVSFSKGAFIDPLTGMKTTYSGLSLEKSHVFINMKRATGKKVPLGDTIRVVLTGVNLYDEEGGLAFPGCTIILTDSKGKEILNLPDAFSAMEKGINTTEAETLEASLNTGEPMEKGKVYLLKCRFWDRKNGKKEITTELEFVAE